MTLAGASDADCEIALSLALVKRDQFSQQAGDVVPAEITIFESLGLAIEDLAAAVVAYRAARDLGAGVWVTFD